MSTTDKTNDWQERELGALWAKKSNNGSQYMTGHIEVKGESGKVQLVVFKNKSKYNEDGTVKNEKAPDLRIYLSEPKEERQNRTEKATEAAPQNDGALF
jgi:uncharacterized protein (DUF736 family)|tara:strand:+ start:386 stop:682 length:297 start_codon:yes stop_codon:yes gene_type:complete